jgi:chromosome segregation ATPase
MTPTLTRIEATDKPVPDSEAASNTAHRRSPQLLQELADGLDYLLSQLEQSEQEGATLKASNASLDELINEQQRALVVSLEMMRRLQGEVDELRKRVDSLAPAAPVTTEDAGPLRQRIAELEKQVAQRSSEVEELTAALSKVRPDPDQALAVLEQQRDQARTDLAMQTAELATKEALIQTLEQALEQQHVALRTLEERFAEYASRLQELRLDRLRLTAPPSRVSHAESQSSLASLARRLFSRPKVETTPEATNAKEGRHA